MSKTETIRWTRADGYGRCRALEARLTDNTLVMITAGGETHTMTTVSDGHGRYVRLPFARFLTLSHADEWTAKVPVENPAHAWLDQAVEGDELDDIAGYRWERTDDGDWRRVVGGTVRTSDDLYRKHGPLTPIILDGKPAVAWADADVVALNHTYEGSLMDTDDECRHSAPYRDALALIRALCTIYDEPEGQR